MNDAVRKAQQAREVKQLTEALSKNEHTLVAMMPNEFMDFVVIQQRRSGLTNDQIIAWIDNAIDKSSEISQRAKQQWETQKSTIKNAGTFLPVILDSKTLAVLAAEMYRGGHIMSKYQVKTHAGRAYVVLKGYPGLRTQLNGTRFLANNTKVVSMGIGKLGAAKAIKGGIIVSVIFSVAFHALEQLLNDRATWHDFVAGVTIDVATAVTGAGIAWGVISMVVGGTAMAAIGPMILVVAVGAVAATALGAVAEHYKLSEKLATMLKDAESQILSDVRQLKYETRRVLNYADENPIGFMHQLFGIPYFGR